MAVMKRTANAADAVSKYSYTHDGMTIVSFGKLTRSQVKEIVANRKAADAADANATFRKVVTESRARICTQVGLDCRKSKLAPRDWCANCLAKELAVHVKS